MTELQRSNLRGAVLALAAFGLFATHDVAVKTLGQSFAPFQIIFFSVLFGFPLAMLMLMRDPEPGTLRPVHPWWMALRAGAGVMTGICGFYAFSVLPLAQTYAFIFAAPLLITLLAIPILGERIGPWRVLAVVAGLAGVLVVLRPGAAPISLGHLAGLGAALGSAIVSVVSRRIGREERPLVMVLYPMLAAFVVNAALMPGVYEPMELIDLGLVAVVAGLGFAAMLMMVQAYRAAPAAVVAPLQYSQMVWAVIYGALIFGEAVDGWTLAGSTIIIGSGLLIVFREVAGSSAHRPVTEAKSRPETAAPRVSAVLMSRALRSYPGHAALEPKGPKEALANAARAG